MKISFIKCSLFLLCLMVFSQVVGATPPSAGKDLDKASFDILKAARLFYEASPNLNWKNVTVHYHTVKEGKRAGWAKMEKREAHIRGRGTIVSQVEVLHHEVMGHIVSNNNNHGPDFLKDRTASAVKLGWLTEEERAKILRDHIAEKDYQKWMYPRIRKWIKANHLVNSKS